MAKKKFDYFGQFTQLSDLAVKEAELLKEAVDNWTPDGDYKAILAKAHEIEHAGDEVNHAIFHSVAIDFVTPIEREDIISMSSELDDLIDQVEAVMQLFYMYDIHLMADDAPRFADIILKSCQAVRNSMDDFSDFKKSKSLRERLIAVNDCEEEGDRIYMEAIRTLHTVHKEEAMRVMVWSRIFDRMERCCDACEHVADTMDTVLLKNA